jgi:hypothetical protein
VNFGYHGWKFQQTVISEGVGLKGKLATCCRTSPTGELRVLMMSEVFLSNMKKFTSYLIENTFISTTKRNQLMLFVVIFI